MFPLEIKHEVKKVINGTRIIFKKPLIKVTYTNTQNNYHQSADIGPQVFIEKK
mgnify:CR=1 FL=1